MGIEAARKYIEDLHKRQENPYLWPDYLTGLPGKAAIIKRLSEVYDHLGRYAIAYIRIANIHPYLIKYGPDKHAEIIQWAAAILKTSCETCKRCLVATVGTHDFIIICETELMLKHIKKVMQTFNKKAEAYYTKEDRTKKTVISFTKDRGKIEIGLMKMVAVIVCSKPGIDKGLLLREMGMACERIDSDKQDVLILDESSEI